jgi:hypothetical protein
MDRLHDAFKIDNSTVYIIMYFLMFITSVIGIGLVISIILMFTNGLTFSQIINTVISLPTSVTNYILYGFAIFIFITIITMLVRSQSSDCKAEYSSTNNSQVSVSKPSVFWRPDTALNPLDPTNLRVSSSEYQPKNCNGLTLGIEMIIFDTRSNTNVYKHILHRGSADLLNYRGGSPGVQGIGGIEDGLPSEMSPGIFIDKLTNDLIVFVDTDNTENSSTTNAYRESVRINDLPLNKAFYLHLVINNKVLEVYINCRLAGTRLLHGNPRNVANEWYGRTGFIGQAIIQNLNLWDGPLNTFDLMNLCAKKIVIKKEITDLASSGTLPSFNCHLKYA